MRFISALANRYRKNGIIQILYDARTGYYDLVFNKNGKLNYITMFRNKSLAVREAKRLAMELQVGFNEALDIII